MGDGAVDPGSFEFLQPCVDDAVSPAKSTGLPSIAVRQVAIDRHKRRRSMSLTRWVLSVAVTSRAKSNPQQASPIHSRAKSPPPYPAYTVLPWADADKVSHQQDGASDASSSVDFLFNASDAAACRDHRTCAIYAMHKGLSDKRLSMLYTSHAADQTRTRPSINNLLDIGRKKSLIALALLADK